MIDKTITHVYSEKLVSKTVREKYVPTYIGKSVEEEQNKRNIRIPFSHCH